MSGNWADDLIAGPMGFQYCVLFPRAREAIKAWTEIMELPIRLPTNVCPVAKMWAKHWTLHDIDDSGLAPGVTTQLYGYRERGDGTSKLDLDPLMTGWFDRPCAESSIISFGQKKSLDLGGGAAFLTRDQSLSEEMDRRGYWPNGLTQITSLNIQLFTASMRVQRENIYLWDRYLGDSCERLPREQTIPWRCMRRIPLQRDAVVHALRGAGFDAGTNYPCLAGVDNPKAKTFERQIINLFVGHPIKKEDIQAACEIIKRVVQP